MVLELLQDMLLNNHLIAAEHKAAVAVIKQLETAEIDEKMEELRILLNPTQVKYPQISPLYLSNLSSGFKCNIRSNRCF